MADPALADRASVEAGRPAGLGIHATAVAIDGRGLLIRGASGVGKSALATALASRPGRRVELVGDDRVLLRLGRDGRVVARPHPRIAGFVERRGLGLVAVRWRERVVLAGCVAIGVVPPAGEAEGWLRELPALRIAPRDAAACRLALDWWDTLADAADRAQVA